MSDKRTQAERDNDVSRANGGIVATSGPRVIFANGSQAWAVSVQAANELHVAVPARRIVSRLETPND